MRFETVSFSPWGIGRLKLSDCQGPFELYHIEDRTEDDELHRSWRMDRVGRIPFIGMEKKASHNYRDFRQMSAVPRTDRAESTPTLYAYVEETVHSTFDATHDFDQKKTRVLALSYRSAAQ